MEKRLFAVRGATGAHNTRSDIEEKIAELYDTILARNHIGELDIVSIIFSVTPDLYARNPAAALRSSGRAGQVPLFCVAEPVSDDAPPAMLRVLIHFYASGETSPVFVYINGAQALRPDLASQ